MGINASVEEVTDIEKIISYGIMRTPALAVVETNGRNVCGSIAIFDFDTDSGVFAYGFGANFGLWSEFWENILSFRYEFWDYSIFLCWILNTTALWHISKDT